MLINNLAKFALVYVVTFVAWILPIVFSTYTDVGPLGVAEGDMISYGFVFVIANVGSFVTALSLMLVNWRLKGISVKQLTLYSVISVFASIMFVWTVGEIGLADFIPAVFIATPCVIALIAYFVLKSETVGNSA